MNVPKAGPNQAKQQCNPSTAVRGGDFHDCLSAADLDELLAPVLGAAYVPAMTLYRVRTEQYAAELARRDIERAISRAKHGLAIAPIHIRFHWTTGIFFRHEGGLGVSVLDSAPSPATARDIEALLKRLQVSFWEILCPAHQERGSNECGVHTIVNAWRAHFGLEYFLAKGTVSLRHLRNTLAELSVDPETVREHARLIATKPTQVKGAGADQPPRIRDEPATEASTARHNQCYIFSALQALDMITSGQTRSYTTRSLARLVSDIGYQYGIQEDVGEAIMRLAPRDPWHCAHAVHVLASEDVIPSTAPVIPSTAAIVLNPLGLAVDLPVGAFETAHVIYTGTVGTHPEHGDYTIGGHYRYVLGPHDPAITSEKPLMPVQMSDKTGAAWLEPRRFVTRNAAHVLRWEVRLLEKQQSDATDAAQLPPREASTPQEEQPNSDDAAALPPTHAPAHLVDTARALRTTEDKVLRVMEDGAAAKERRRSAMEASKRNKHQAAETTPVSKRQQKRAAMESARPPVAYSSQGKVKARLNALQLVEGDPIYVHWATEKDAGKCYGQVVHITPSGAAKVRFQCKLCDSCLAPRGTLADVVAVPASKITYFAIEKQRAPRIAPCVCADIPNPEPLREDEAELDHPAPEDCPQQTGRTSAPDGSHDAAAAPPDPAQISAEAVATDKVKRSVVSSPAGVPLFECPRAAEGQLRGDVGSKWFIPHGKPAWVHELVWRQLADTTRQGHQRWLRCIKGMPTDLRGWPLANAVTELIMRMAYCRKWVWSTVASAFAACNAALAALSIYTTEARPINIGSDPYFAAAAKNAQKEARGTASQESLTAGLSREQFQQLTSSDGIKGHKVRLLLQLMWHFASRPKEMREARPCDVQIRHERPDGCSHVSITFHTGKVVPYCGPYTVHVILPKEVTCALQAAIAEAKADEPLFTTSHQAALAGVISRLQGRDDGLPRLGLRSIRRGAVMHQAANGVPDVELLHLTGHKRLETLLRYLGWGRASATMRSAAEARHKSNQVRGAGANDQESRTSLSPAQQPPKMGPHSGYKGIKGRRVPPPPEFFPKSVPSRAMCGINQDHIDTSNYKLHIKNTSRVDWPAILQMARQTPLHSEAELARQWCETDKFYGPRIPVEPAKVPAASFTVHEMEQLLAANKIQPHRGPINGYVHAFTIPQHKKQRWRVIAEPVINATCGREYIYKVHYPSRLERRARARGARFEAELDFAAYFDQFELSKDVLSWFVFRSRYPIDGETLFTLTRLPMGVTFAPSVAQAVTSVLVMPLVYMEGVRVDTCIDNIRIVADTEAQFLKAMRLILQRIHDANITLNDAEDWQVPDDELLERCRVTDAPRKFLGEQYIRDTVSNTDDNLEKLQLALQRFEQGSAKETYTLRNFASLVGLMLFMAHTINVDLSQYHTLLRAYGTIISDTGGWDKECSVTSEAVRAQLTRMAQHILANPRVPLPVLRQPSRSLDDYDVAIEVDASGSAWGAIVRFNKTGDVFILQQRWTVSMLHSARAEPTAATRAIRWAREKLGANASVAVITDHAAMVTGQRRWESRYGGFSSSGYHLNEFYRELYDAGGGEVFHVEGEHNRADGISRDPSATSTLKVSQSDVTFRELYSVTHPFEILVRKEYQV